MAITKEELVNNINEELQYWKRFLITCKNNKITVEKSLAAIDREISTVEATIRSLESITSLPKDKES